MGASVVTGMDTSPVLGPAEHILDFVALAVAHSADTKKPSGESVAMIWTNSAGASMHEFLNKAATEVIRHHPHSLRLRGPKGRYFRRMIAAIAACAVSAILIN
jgi:hypothetical protein